MMTKTFKKGLKEVDKMCPTDDIQILSDKKLDSRGFTRETAQRSQCETESCHSQIQHINQRIHTPVKSPLPRTSQPSLHPRSLLMSPIVSFQAAKAVTHKPKKVIKYKKLRNTTKRELVNRIQDSLNVKSQFSPFRQQLNQLNSEVSGSVNIHEEHEDIPAKSTSKSPESRTVVPPNRCTSPKQQNFIPYLSKTINPVPEKVIGLNCEEFNIITKFAEKQEKLSFQKSNEAKIVPTTPGGSFEPDGNEDGKKVLQCDMQQKAKYNCKIPGSSEERIGLKREETPNKIHTEKAKYVSVRINQYLPPCLQRSPEKVSLLQSSHQSLKESENFSTIEDNVSGSVTQVAAHGMDTMGSREPEVQSQLQRLLSEDDTGKFFALLKGHFFGVISDCR